MVKILKSHTLNSDIEELLLKFESLENQLRLIRKNIDSFTSLSDDFSGKSGNSIRMFYHEIHVPFLLLFEQTIRNYKEQLKTTVDAFEKVDSDKGAYIHEAFIEGDLRQGLEKSSTITQQIVDDVNTALSSVSDIVWVSKLSDDTFQKQVYAAKKLTQKTVDELNQADNYTTYKLTTIDSDLNLLYKYISEIREMFQSKEITISSYSFRQVSNNDVYKDVLDEITDNTRPTLKELGAKASFLPLTYVSMRYPGPWQYLYNLISKKSDESLKTKYEEWKISNNFKRKTITQEEFESLEDRLVDVVKRIDEYGEFGGDYHIYDNGIIVRVIGNDYYEIVDSVPDADRVGGVEELDSFFEGTPLAALEYLSRPSTFIEKKLGKKIDDAIGIIGNKIKKDKNVKKEIKNNSDGTFTEKLRGIDVTITDIRTKEIDYVKRSREDTTKLRKAFDQRIRKQFLIDLSNKVDYIKDAGFSDEDILRMRKGRLPEGWEVHHKVPLDGGGTNSFDNLVLIQKEPHHKVLTNFQNTFSREMAPGEVKKVDFPIPDGDLYPKKH